MDPVVVVGALLAAAGATALIPSAVRSVRHGRVPVVAIVVGALLFLSVDWTAGAWPRWHVALVFLGWAVLLVLYPDGRPTPRWTTALLATYAAITLGGAVLPADFGAPPWPLLLLGGLAAAAGAQVWRYRRRSGPVEREAAQWLLLGLAVTATVLLTADLTGATADPDTGSWWWAALRLVGMVLPLSAAFGMVATTHVAANLAVLRMGAACGTVVTLAAVHRLLEPRLGAGALATVLAAASPLVLLGCTRLLEPVVYRTGSHGALRRLGDLLRSTVGPDDVARTVEQAVRYSLGVPRAEVRFAAASPGGQGDERAEHFSIPYQGRDVGALVVWPREAEASLSRRDRALVGTLAEHAGPALHGARVVHELRAARERLVTAREEERRRIRRDLHDDLGPSLAGLRLSASALLGHLSTAPVDGHSADVRRLAEDLASGIGDASALVRRVVYDLQPADLDARGLLVTLHDRLATEDGDMRVRVRAHLEPDDLPAAVEVATARIVAEAVTNARRHAGARTCSVVLTRAPDALTIEVADDGHGMAAGTPLGVGLRSIEERADELGGTSELVSGPAGTTVRVTLPLAPQSARELR